MNVLVSLTLFLLVSRFLLVSSQPLDESVLDDHYIQLLQILQNPMTDIDFNLESEFEFDALSPVSSSFDAPAPAPGGLGSLHPIPAPQPAPAPGLGCRHAPVPAPRPPQISPEQSPGPSPVLAPKPSMGPSLAPVPEPSPPMAPSPTPTPEPSPPMAPAQEQSPPTYPSPPPPSASSTTPPSPLDSRQQCSWPPLAIPWLPPAWNHMRVEIAKCWEPLCYVPHCEREIFLSSRTRDFGLIEPKCCDAIAEISPYCERIMFRRGFPFFFFPERLISYCTTTTST